MEQKGAEYHKKVRDGFLEVARLHNHFVVVNSAPDIETVHKHIVDIICQAEFDPSATRVKS
jgi:thymidylate kinase